MDHRPVNILVSRDALVDQELGDVFIDWLGATTRMRNWVDKCLKMIAPSSAPSLPSGLLALVLAPKTGKTHAMVRVLRPLIYEVFHGRTPLVMYLDLTSITLPRSHGAPAADLESTFRQLTDRMKRAAAQQGVHVPITCQTPEEQLLELVQSLGAQRPTFLLLDEIGRVLQGPREQAMRFLDVFKGLVKQPGVFFAIAGSGMVHFLAQMIDQGANGFRLFDIIHKLDLSAHVTEKISQFAAQQLVARHKEELVNFPEMDAATLYTMGQLCVTLAAPPHPALLHFVLREFLKDSSADSGEGDRVHGAIRRTQLKFHRDFKADW